MNGCSRYQEMISRMLDDDLSQSEKNELAAHVKRCPDCAAVYVAFRSLSENLGAALEEPSPDLHEKIMADVRREGMRRKNTVHHLNRRWRSVLAAAACLVLIVAAGLSFPKLGLRKSAAPAPAAAFEEPVTEAEEEVPVPDLFRVEAAPSLGLQANTAAEAPAEEPAAAPADEPAEAAEDKGMYDSHRSSRFLNDGETLILDKEQSEALRERMTKETASSSDPQAKILYLSYLTEKGRREELTVVIGETEAVYVRYDGDLCYRIDATPAELYELFGLDR